MILKLMLNSLKIWTRRSEGIWFAACPSLSDRNWYFQYQSKFQIPQMEFNKMLEETSDADPTRVRKQQGGAFEQRIAGDEQQSLTKEVGASLQRTIKWPSYSQSLKGPVTAGVAKSWRYLKEKSQKNREGKVRAKDSTKIRHEKETEKSK